MRSRKGCLHKKSYTVILFVLLTLAVNVHAGQDTDNLLDKINPAWQRLDTLSRDSLTEEQQKTLQKLAFATVSGDICAGIDVDREKFVAAFQIFNDSSLQAMSPDKQKMQEQKRLVLYGIATGLYSAEGQLATDEFCAAAEELRQKPENNYWKDTK